MKTLQLSHNPIEGPGVETLAEALKINSSLTSLEVHDIDADEDYGREIKEFRLLFDALKFNSTLSSLRLGNNSFGEEGHAKLWEMLKINSSLTSVQFSDIFCPINVNGVSEMLAVNTSLNSLTLGKLDGDDEPFDHQNQMQGEQLEIVMKGLTNNSTLQSLVISDLDVDDQAARSVAQMLRANSSLTDLKLLDWSVFSMSGLTEILESLRFNSSLATLHCTIDPYEPDPKIGSRMWTTLADLLKGNSSLTAFSCRSDYDSLADNNSQMDSEGRNALAAALAVNTTLRSLELKGLQHSFDEVSFGELAAAINHNSSLTACDMGRFPDTLNEVKTQIGAVMERNQINARMHQAKFFDLLLLLSQGTATTTSCLDDDVTSSDSSGEESDLPIKRQRHR